MKALVLLIVFFGVWALSFVMMKWMLDNINMNGPLMFISLIIAGIAVAIISENE